MAATGTLIPAAVDQTIVIGADWSATINLYQDTAQTIAFDLTGYTVTMLISTPTPITLAVGSGITVTTPTNGTVVAALTSAQTLAQAVSQYPGSRYSLKLVDGSGVVSYPLSGNIMFRAP